MADAGTSSAALAVLLLLQANEEEAEAAEEEELAEDEALAEEALAEDVLRRWDEEDGAVVRAPRYCYGACVFVARVRPPGLLSLTSRRCFSPQFAPAYEAAVPWFAHVALGVADGHRPFKLLTRSASCCRGSCPPRTRRPCASSSEKRRRWSTVPRTARSTSSSSCLRHGPPPRSSGRRTPRCVCNACRRPPAGPICVLSRSDLANHQLEEYALIRRREPLLQHCFGFVVRGLASRALGPSCGVSRSAQRCQMLQDGLNLFVQNAGDPIQKTHTTTML